MYTLSVRLIELIAPLRETVASEVAASEIAARACWSCVIEAGDGSAGALINAVGATSIFRLLDGDHGGVLRELADTEPEVFRAHDWHSAFGRWLPRCTEASIEPLVRAARHLSAQLLVPGDAAWPQQLADLGDHAPVALWVRGESAALAHDARALALVGARASTGYGNEVAGMLAVAAADAGLTVISGGAYGIDERSHRVALASHGRTCAVLAGGVDQLYPARNITLFHELIDSGGAVVSEAPPGRQPARWRFLTRNRLIAALAPATIVVEAGARSGAVNTANHAQQLGRELGAVPGPVTSAASVGCNRLLREQLATLVSSGEDAIELWHQAVRGLSAACAYTESRMLAGAEPQPEAAGSATITGAGQRLGDGLTTTALRTLDALPRRGGASDTGTAAIAGLSLADTRRALSELELLGRVEYGLSGWHRVH